jgi:DNA-binding CsgD family transcriptional regulator
MYYRRERPWGAPVDRYQLSDFALQLVDEATRSDPLSLQDRLIEKIRDLIRFEKAWYGWSLVREKQVILVNTATFGLPRIFEPKVRGYLAQDPLLSKSRGSKLFAGAMTLQDAPYDDAIKAEAKEHGIEQALVGHSEIGAGPFTFFMSLYRGANADPFSEVEIRDMRMILLHIEQALSLSLTLETNRRVHAHAHWAIVGRNGELFLSSTQFQAVLQKGRSRGQSEQALLSELVSRGRAKLGSMTATCQTYAEALELLVLEEENPWQSLSLREQEVAIRLIAGDSTLEVAAAHNVSPNTVRNQIASIYQKTGAKNRVDLVRICGEEHLGGDRVSADT